MTDWYRDKKILLAVSGGIAAYKAAELTRLLIKQGAQVRVMMTQAAQAFIPAKTLAILSQNPVLTDASWQRDGDTVDHVAWANWANLILVVPATANLIGKIAQGLADDVVSTTIMASRADKVLAPAMNDGMWASPALQRNISQLKADDWLIIDPVTGFLAEGYEGTGRLADLNDIVNQLPIRLLARVDNILKDKQVVITAGGTQEALDPVRYLTNRSSGKMGYALAEAAAERGAQVILIATVKRPVPYGVKLIKVSDTQSMLGAVESYLPGASVFIAAAAVSDFRPVQLAKNKIKKMPGQTSWQLALTLNPDILATVGQAKKPQQVVVGFAAETQNLADNAQKKLASKGADMIVANDVSDQAAGFNSNDNAVILFIKNQSPQTVALADKLVIARKIIDQTMALLASKVLE
ncbi:bifunctional phosphopantothenoylcysteine decarboxylase/phosphopantothenate--cysteine ligase CoaBC [Convivina intestini]|uniref:Coenzyme A biosynthesis bifunctional protein CoaBC n=1 Tax=Convivina intestini TaxID=1505726 RepID=A0A2U1DEW0_9LACO|nr:bifunctional phosphopantothenoylcysteine decarboxylase/phosphopantothenate--cysteine ligase CoaBC [Convivina intestini]PVY86119.1 phosphopantothenate-cysteine ligase /phosphopantothenoylcysteine decarboxylase [Convivina intestini]CAH1851452.1 Coenzyme A biosynthesis bifunctional protein CoaBC [Convivina intestini]CAH1853043.1 Coenzyme A biosynthesis bifunctional protein CoaBC [Convivina intestini]SDB80893.1 Phosphopantothenate-cysteine ligase [Leuconostocaceae bacterium R-53105]